MIHILFENQVDRTPDAIAVVYKGNCLTYAELNARANQLASHLTEKGVGPDRIVGICAERSIETVVGLLGILKAGGAYVPLDPGYPSARLWYMARDAAPELILVQDEQGQRFSATEFELISLSTEWSGTKRRSVENPDPTEVGVVPENLAYVMYTSGSTGRPKGVMIEHRHVLNLRNGLKRACRQEAECLRTALNASLNFDASVQQIIQLTFGNTLVLVPEEARRDGEMMLDFLNGSRISSIDCTPSQLRSWVYSGLLEPNRSPLRTVLVGGESIDPALWGDLGRCSQIDFYNVYGPTECTVDATLTRVSSDVSDPHIGQPMLNRNVYILSNSGQPVAIGAAGEIHIGGEGVGRGYLNRPETTAELYLPDPFSSDRGARMYRTGDLGRWREDGNIDFLGRSDQQVKIRGFRIELGEIEAHLRNHARVQEAVAIAREDTSGECQLVAYVVLQQPVDATPSASAFHAHLASVLPAYMVPSAYVVLDRMPLTSSGKLDKRALPPPSASSYMSRHPYERPDGELETAIAGIWRQLLNRDEIGRYDNFFDLGGHSLLAMQVSARARDSLALDIPVSSIFDSPTLRELADHIATNRDAYLIRATSDEDPYLDDLLKTISSLPEDRVGELLNELATEERRDGSKF